MVLLAAKSRLRLLAFKEVSHVVDRERSAVGLLDHSDPDTGRRIRERLDIIGDELGSHYHGVRYRTTGYHEIIEVHLLFPHETPLGEARRLASLLEERLPAELGKPTEVITHLESPEGHEHVLAREHSTGRPSRDAIADS